MSATRVSRFNCLENRREKCKSQEAVQNIATFLDDLLLLPLLVAAAC